MRLADLLKRNKKVTIVHIWFKLWWLMMNKIACNDENEKIVKIIVTKVGVSLETLAAAMSQLGRIGWNNSFHHHQSHHHHHNHHHQSHHHHHYHHHLHQNHHNYHHHFSSLKVGKSTRARFIWGWGPPLAPGGGPVSSLASFI